MMVNKIKMIFSTFKTFKTFGEEFRFQKNLGSICFAVKYFSMQNDFRENIYIFFFVFSCILKNVSENILQCYAKDIAEGARGEACIFGKWFTKKLGVNHFSNFNKGFSSQRKLFSV
jgi:hypothetical protein